MADGPPRGQLLHLVFGGELTDIGRNEFKDLDKLDIVGIYPDYASAHAAWKAKAQQTVDNAHMRYFIVHMHRLLDPQFGYAEQGLIRSVDGMDDDGCQVWKGLSIRGTVEA